MCNKKKKKKYRHSRYSNLLSIFREGNILFWYTFSTNLVYNMVAACIIDRILFFLEILHYITNIIFYYLYHEELWWWLRYLILSFYIRFEVRKTVIDNSNVNWVAYAQQCQIAIQLNLYFFLQWLLLELWRGTNINFKNTRRLLTFCYLIY